MKHYLFLPVFFLLLFSSCYNKRYIDIQVLTPSAIQIPKINTLILENEKSSIKPHNLKDSIQLNYYSFILREFYKSLKEKLKESPAFEKTNILLMNSNEVKDYGQRENAYIIKCRFKLKVDTTYSHNRLYWSDFGIYVNYYNFYFQLSCLYDSTMTDLNQISDVHVYAKKNVQENELEGISELAKIAADKYYLRLAPHWSTVERMMFYTPNKLMKKGYISFCENNLDESVIYWKKLSEVGTSRLAAKAAHNLGLIYEMQDNLDSSEYYLTQSLRKKFGPLTKSYLDTVRARKLNRIYLDKQLQ